MQVRGQFKDFFFDTMLPAVNAKIWKTFKAKQAMAPLVLGHETTNRSIEQYSQLAGVGLPTLVAEGEDTPTDTFVQGPNKTFTPVKYGLGIPATQELVEDDKMGIINKRASALANSIFQAREIQAASVINNAFDPVAQPLPDGKALIAADHPLIKAGGAQNNLLPANADLDVTSLASALTDWELIKTHEGFLQLLPKPRVLVAASNRWNVAEILKSQYRSDTANHTINAFQYNEQGGPIDFLCWAYITDQDSWYLVAPPENTEMLWLDRKMPYTKEDYVEKNECGVIYMRYRAAVGCYGWGGIYGTPGAP